MKKVTLLSLFALCTIVAMLAKPTSTSAATPLSDGFYKADGKYYYVVNEYRARIRKGTTFATLLHVAQKGGATGISAEDMLAVQTLDCEWDNAFYTIDPTLRAQCEMRMAIGEELRDRLAGKLVLETEVHGFLSYIPKEISEYPVVPIRKNWFDQTFFQYAKGQAQRVNKQRLLSLTKWRSVDSLAQ